MKKYIVPLLILSLSAFTNAEEVRLVVSKPSANYGQMKTQSVSKGNSIIKVEAGSEQEALELVRASGKYKTVEIDYKTYIPKPRVSVASPVRTQSKTSPVRMNKSNIAPNDPEYVNQRYWESPEVDANGTSWNGKNNIFEAYKGYTPILNTRIAVIDSSFGRSNDVDYDEGYGFATVYGKSRSANFYTEDDVIEITGFAHGLSVAGIIGAKTNNNIGMAGIARTQIVAAESMYGGNGYLSDTTDAIRWVIGEKVDGVPMISRPVNVINMSLSSDTGSCPDFFQDAINAAYNKGIIIVAAAGNYEKNASHYSPANCENVIVVGASDTRGFKADFSNFGNDVDILAMGEQLYAPGPYGKYYWWDGTSQAAPIVSGTILMAVSEFSDITQSEIIDIMKLTANSPASNADGSNSCDNGNCGAGIFDAGKFMEQVRDYKQKSKSSVVNVANLQNDCVDKKILDIFKDKHKFCDLFEFNIEADSISTVGINEIIYNIYKVTNDKFFTISNATKVLETNDAKFVTGVNNFDDGSEYGYTVCKGGVCDIELRSLDTKGVKKPAICN